MHTKKPGHVTVRQLLFFTGLNKTWIWSSFETNHLNAVEKLDQQTRLCLLEVKVLESEVCFHNSSSFDSGSQHILLGGYISPMGYPLQVIQVTLGRQKLLVKTDVCTSAEFSSTFPCKCVSATNSLCCRVVELVLSRATEASLNSSIIPEPLDDTGQFACHESLFCWPRQYEQLPCIVLPRQSLLFTNLGFS